MKTRIEKDSMGPLEVPADAYYGVQTQRAVDEFPDQRLAVAAAVDPRHGAHQTRRREDESRTGLDRQEDLRRHRRRRRRKWSKAKLDAQFPVDIFQTGSGTSTNMNTNEVIASRANEILGGKRGDKSPVHPNDHVNLCQSSNDVFPTAIHISVIEAIQRGTGARAASICTRRWRRKRSEFDDVMKIGRTHLQDATPIRLGQEFSGMRRRWSTATARQPRRSKC